MEHTQERLLAISAELFAQQGYAGVSMRNIGKAAGITQAAIYHHFASKDELYLAAVGELMERQRLVLEENLSAIEDPQEKLRQLVADMLRLLSEDDQFRRIYFRELLDADDSRLEALTEHVFSGLHETLTTLMTELAPEMDSHLLIMSLAGLIFHHLESMKLSRFLPDSKPEHQQLPVLAEHISRVFLCGVSR
jgi:TetR/AcrR family transcriptional regulator